MQRKQLCKMVLLVITGLLTVMSGCSKEQEAEKESPETSNPEKQARQNQPTFEPPVSKPEGEEGKWYEDFEEAKRIAAREGKDLFIDFTGSDWCGWCIKLHKEVLSHAEFLAYTAEHFVLVKLDYPRNKSLVTEEIQQQNEILKNQYHIRGYPTILLTDATGKVYAKTGYRPNGPGPYVEHLKELQEAKTTITQLLNKAATLSGLDKAKVLDEAVTIMGQETAEAYYPDIIDQIIQLDADNTAGLKNKYEIPRQIAKIHEARIKGDLDQVVKIADATLSGYELSVDDTHLIHYIKGYMYDRKGNAEQAVASYQAALEANATGRFAGTIKKKLDRLTAEPVEMVQAGKIVTTLRAHENNVAEKAFDGQVEGSYFWSARGLKSGDVFTLTLDEPKAVKKIIVYTGDEEHKDDYLHEGVLEVSGDGKNFTEAAPFREGTAQAELENQEIRAVRIKATADQQYWLIIREIVLE